MLDKRKLEACLRVGLATLIGTSLAVAEIPSVVPPALNFVVGMATVSMIVTFPRLVSTILMIFPAALVGVVLALLSSSAILAAGIVSNGLFVTVFGTFAFINAGFFYGKMFDSTGGLANLLTLFAGMMALSLRTLVQQGFSFPIDPLSLPLLSSQASQEAIESVCIHLQFQNCTIDALASYFNETLDTVLSTPISFVIPEIRDYSMFAGQTAMVVATNGTATVHIPGGLWVIKGFWTWSGTDNSLAVYRNFIIVMCWSLVCISIAILFPPVRASWQLSSRFTTPALLRKVVEPQSDWNELISLLNVVDPSSTSKVLFEPRLQSPCYSMISPLKELLDRANRTAFALIYLV
jgi:hypothetical protein